MVVIRSLASSASTAYSAGLGLARFAAGFGLRLTRSTTRLGLAGSATTRLGLARSATTRLGLTGSATTVSATGCLTDLPLTCTSATGMTLAASVLHFVLLEALFKNFHLFRALLSRSAAGFSARTTPAGFCHFS